MLIFFECKKYMHCAIEQKVEIHVWFAYIFQLFEVQNRMWSRWGVQSGHRVTFFLYHLLYLNGAMQKIKQVNPVHALYFMNGKS